MAKEQDWCGRVSRESLFSVEDVRLLDGGVNWTLNM